VIGPQTLALGTGAVLVGIVDYRLMFVGVGAVVAVAAGYVWLGRGLSTADPTATDPTATDPTATDPTVTDPTVTDPTVTDPTAPQPAH
jgi:hypothetical protein